MKNFIRRASRSRGFLMIGADDGIDLRICFARDGEKSEGDIVFLNTWRSELDPLIDRLSDLAGKDSTIKFAEIVRRYSRVDDETSVDVVEGVPLRAFNRTKNYAPLPWWCLWPHFLADNA